MMGEVSPVGRGDEVPAPELRASHEDRDRVVEMLRVAAGDGRLTAEELDERLEVAMTARTYGELAGLTRDLPATAAEFVVDARLPKPKELVRIDCRSGSAKRDGRWVVPERLEVKVASGSVTLDFTEAVITKPLLRIDAEVNSGSLTLVTRPGIAVDTGNVSVRSGSVKVRPPSASEVPVGMRIEMSGKVGSGSIKARPPRRTFWQWLTRKPRPAPRAVPPGRY